MCTACLVQASFLALKMSDWLQGSWHSIQRVGLYPAMVMLSLCHQYWGIENFITDPVNTERWTIKYREYFLIDNLGDASLLLVDVTRYSSSLMWGWSGFCFTDCQNTGSFKEAWHPRWTGGKGLPRKPVLANLSGGTCLRRTRRGNWRGVSGKRVKVCGWEEKPLRERSRTHFGVPWIVTGSVSKETISWGLNPAGFRAEEPYVKSLNKQGCSKK